jgi:SMODS-associating 2TM, beta-strand rich effector domain
MPTPNWTRFILLLFVGGTFIVSLLVGVLGHGVARYAGIGTVMSLVVLVLLVIERWAWRWPGVRAILRMPDLEGTWEVELDSTFGGDGGGSKTIYLVIHQTYSTVVVEVLTNLGRSCSEAASVTKRGPRRILSYVYRAEPEATRRVGNEPHRGAAELLIETDPKLRFEGNYWTDRGTTGTLRASGRNKKKCGSFVTAATAAFERAADGNVEFSEEGEVRPTEGTLDLLYDEVSRDLEGQHEYIEALNQRAQQLFGFAILILTILAAVTPSHRGTATKAVFAAGIPFFALAAFYSGLAWEFLKWRLDPDVRVLWDRYRGKSEEHVRHQVIQNRLDCLNDNQGKLELKLKRIKRARLWLYLGFAYLVALLLYRVISG